MISDLERFVSSMSFHSYQVEQLTLGLNWKGQSVSLAGNQGIIAAQDGGELVVFDPAEMTYLDERWTLLLGYERAHGWFSVSALRLPCDLSLNGHVLKNGPLMMKESTLVMPPQSNASLELFLTESFAEIVSSGFETAIRREAKPSSSQESVKLATQEAVETLRLNRELAKQCCSEYGFLKVHGELIEIDKFYSFGALRVEMTDNECWIFSGDGILLVNGIQRKTSQVYVGDQVQWQEHSWFVVGKSVETRIDPLEPEFAFKVETLSSIDLEDDLLLSPTDSSIPSQLESHGNSRLSDQDVADFKERLAGWLYSKPTLESEHGEQFRHSLDRSGGHATEGNVSHLALLRLGRRSHFWKNYDLESESQLQSSLTEEQEAHIRRKAAINGVPKAMLLGVLGIAVIGAVGLLGVVLFSL